VGDRALYDFQQWSDEDDAEWITWQIAPTHLQYHQ
jgi:hypothetical protein